MSWPDSDGQQGARGDKESLDGQRFGLGGSPRPLPGHGDASLKTLLRSLIHPGT